MFFGHVLKSQHSKINIEWMGGLLKMKKYGGFLEKPSNQLLKASPAYPTAYYDVLPPSETFMDNFGIRIWFACIGRIVWMFDCSLGISITGIKKGFFSKDLEVFYW